MSSEANIRVEWVGAEHEPVVSVDHFSGAPELLRQAAMARELREFGQYYPGVRAPADPDYFDAVGPALRRVLREFFGYSEGMEVLVANYSLSTRKPQDLSLAQRIPHVDAYDDRQVGIVHFLNPVDLGGTAFFRQRATGYETVNAGRASAYLAALAAGFHEHGEPEPAYIGADSKLFERIHLGEHAMDRALIYRGKLLHCAWLCETPLLPDNASDGRLTIASFVRPAQR
jgi:hypothetical protein